MGADIPESDGHVVLCGQTIDVAVVDFYQCCRIVVSRNVSMAAALCGSLHLIVDCLFQLPGTRYGGMLHLLPDCLGSGKAATSAAFCRSSSLTYM